MLKVLSREDHTSHEAATALEEHLRHWQLHPKSSLHTAALVVLVLFPPPRHNKTPHHGQPSPNIASAKTYIPFFTKFCCKIFILSYLYCCWYESKLNAMSQVVFTTCFELFERCIARAATYGPYFLLAKLRAALKRICSFKKCEYGNSNSHYSNSNSAKSRRKYQNWEIMRQYVKLLS